MRIIHRHRKVSGDPLLFIHQCHQYETGQRSGSLTYREYLRKQYYSLFEDDPPPSLSNQELKTCIGYELQFRKSDRPPPKIRRNRKACIYLRKGKRKKAMRKFSASFRQLIRIEQEAQNERERKINSRCTGLHEQISEGRRKQFCRNQRNSVTPKSIQKDYQACWYNPCPNLLS